ncbi:MAG: LysM domain-containing protein [Planctomycetota bacterium]
MAKTPTKQRHTVKKGDTLESIAKKYGHKQWKAIWNDPENKKVVRKRGEPQKIEPGDVLVIPLTDKQKKEVQKKLDALHEDRDTQIKLLEVIDGEGARIDAKIKRYDQLIKSHQDATGKIVAQLNGDLKGMKKWGSGVDVAANLINLGRGLAKLGKTAYDASKASGEALKKINEEGLKQVIDMKKGQAKDLGVMAAKSMKDNESQTAAAIGILADSYSKMTSPSFWANTWVQMTQNGKSWSEAVTMEVGDDIKQRIAEVKAQSNKLLKTLQDRKADEQSRKKQLPKDAAAAQQRIKLIEQEVAELPDI